MSSNPALQPRSVGGIGPSPPNRHASHRSRRFVAPSLAFGSLLLFLTACAHQPARQQITFTGAVAAGEAFQHPFGGRFFFVLEPSEFGWTVAICEKARNENLARLTPPFHSVPNPREIEGWHFRNEENTGPNDGSVNAPQVDREFIFSPEVGHSIDGPTAYRQPTREEVDCVNSFGRGAFHIEKLSLSPVKDGNRARILKMEFRCTISWPNRNETLAMNPAVAGLGRSTETIRNYHEKIGSTHIGGRHFVVGRLWHHASRHQTVGI
jgi:hypothetical protein